MRCANTFCYVWFIREVITTIFSFIFIEIHDRIGFSIMEYLESKMLKINIFYLKESISVKIKFHCFQFRGMLEICPFPLPECCGSSIPILLFLNVEITSWWLYRFKNETHGWRYQTPWKLQKYTCTLPKSRDGSSLLTSQAEKNVFKNYRPISILPLFSKVAEKLKHSRFTTFFTKHSI